MNMQTLTLFLLLWLSSAFRHPPPSSNIYNASRDTKINATTATPSGYEEASCDGVPTTCFVALRRDMQEFERRRVFANYDNALLLNQIVTQLNELRDVIIAQGETISSDVDRSAIQTMEVIGSSIRDCMSMEQFSSSKRTTYKYRDVTKYERPETAKSKGTKQNLEWAGLQAKAVEDDRYSAFLEFVNFDLYFEDFLHKSERQASKLRFDVNQEILKLRADHANVMSAFRDLLQMVRYDAVAVEVAVEKSGAHDMPGPAFGVMLFMLALSLALHVCTLTSSTRMNPTDHQATSSDDNVDSRDSNKSDKDVRVQNAIAI